MLPLTNLPASGRYKSPPAGKGMRSLLEGNVFKCMLSGLASQCLFRDEASLHKNSSEI